MYYKSKSYRVFNIINNIFLIFVALMCVVPLVHIFAVSLSAKSAADANLVSLWPVHFTFESYKKTLANGMFLSSLWISVLRTVIGTLITLAITFLAAYPLSKEDSYFQGRKYYAWIFVVTMVFSGGLVPFYITIQKLGLMDTFWVLVIPGAVNVFLVILMLNFFRGIPRELEEASLIDGAGHFRTLFNIYLPISLPSIATIALFSMVWHWNSWFDGLLYINDPKDYPLATYLQTIIIQKDMSKFSIDPREFELLSQKTINAAQIFIGAGPILIVYPFMQKYFVKGLVLGSVKE